MTTTPSNSIVTILFTLMAGILVYQATIDLGYAWVATGAVAYAILLITHLFDTEQPDIATTPEFGQVFLIFYILGPLLLILLAPIIEDIYRKATK